MSTTTTTIALGLEPLTIDLPWYVGPSASATWDRNPLEMPYYHIEFRCDQESSECTWECWRRLDYGDQHTVFSYEFDRPAGASLEYCLEQCEETLKAEKQAAWDNMPTYTVYVRSMWGDPVPNQTVCIGSDEIAFEEVLDEFLVSELEEEIITKVLEKVIENPQLWGKLGTISWGVSATSFTNLLLYDTRCLGETDQDGRLTFKFPPAGTTFVVTDQGEKPPDTPWSWQPQPKAYLDGEGGGYRTHDMEQAHRLHGL